VLILICKAGKRLRVPKVSYTVVVITNVQLDNKTKAHNYVANHSHSLRRIADCNFLLQFPAGGVHPININGADAGWNRIIHGCIPRLFLKQATGHIDSYTL
jgi:hypothetical protein